MAFTPSKPDFNIAALDKKTDQKSNVGVAWKQDDGTIRLKLNAFLVLDTSRQDLVITLFPITNGYKGFPETKKRKDEVQTAVQPVDEGQDIPF